MRIIKFAILVSLFYSGICYSQNLKTYAPASPAAANLGSYGDIPISYYTGTVEISIPVYTLKTNEINLPIKLQYKADGLKTMGEATYVGLDWSLTNSGVITRSINALDDFSSKGYFRNAPSTKGQGKSIDPQPDVFSYNFNGRSGKFLIDYPGVVRFLRKEDDVRIELSGDDNFTVTTEDGLKYYFTKREYQSQNIVIDDKNFNYNVITSWFLTSIVAINGESMNFNYLSSQAKTVVNHITSTNTKVVNYSTTPLPGCANLWEIEQIANSYYSSSSATTNSITDEVLLDNIVYKGGKVQFNYSSRIDLNNDPQSPVSRKLDNLVITNNENNLIKQCQFIYDYFASGSTQPNHISKRLKLIAFKESAYNVSNNNYTFLYNDDVAIPDKIEVTSEPYGYYEQNPTACLLKKITYPTGGSSNFTYNTQGEYGARIAKNETKDHDGLSVGIKIYDYTKLDANNQPVSTGRKIHNNAVYSYTRTTNVHRTCTDPNTGNQVWGYDISLHLEMRNKTNIAPLEASVTGAGYAYDQVTVFDGLNGENGKSVYYYYNVANTGASDLQIPGTHDQRNGLLLKEEHYKYISNKNFSLVKKVIYNPQVRDQVAMSGNNWSTYLDVGGPQTYFVNTINVVNSQDEVWLYNDPNPIHEITNYTYHSQYQKPASITTFSSNNDEVKKIFKYSFDMVGQPYQNMAAANIIDKPIEEEYQVNGVVTKKTTNIYTQDWLINPNLILLKYVDIKKGNNNPEHRIQYHSYNAEGQPTTLSNFGGPKISYLWGYNRLYAIASCQNAGEDEIAFSSCEEPLTDAQANSNGTNISFHTDNINFFQGTAHTGRRSFLLTPGNAHKISTVKVMPAGKYILSYWSKGSGMGNTSVISLNSNFTILSSSDSNADSKGWEYHEMVLNIPTADRFNIYPNALGISFLIDDIRIYPVNSSMTSYTYDPLVGVTSIMDSKGSATYYEYDNFQRLTNIRDQDGKILKNHKYNFKP